MTISKAEYLGKVQWLKENSEQPHWRVKPSEREVRAYEREHGVPEAEIATGTWWVATLRGVLSSKVRHLNRHCLHIDGIPDDAVRKGTPEEIRELPPCQTCAE